MLNKLNRIAKEKDYSRFFGLNFRKNRGRSIFSNNLLIKALRSDKEAPRFGIIVSSKVDNRAVVRNKVKRQLREIIRLKVMPNVKGIDFVILANPAIKKLEYKEIEADLLGLLKRLGV